MFMILIVVMVSQTHTYVKINQILHFKYVQGNTCQLYFNKVIFFKLTFHHFQRIDWRGGSGTLGGSETKVLSSLSSSEGDVF